MLRFFCEPLYLFTLAPSLIRIVSCNKIQQLATQLFQIHSFQISAEINIYHNTNLILLLNWTNYITGNWNTGKNFQYSKCLIIVPVFQSSIVPWNSNDDSSVPISSVPVIYYWNWKLTTLLLASNPRIFTFSTIKIRCSVQSSIRNIT